MATPRLGYDDNCQRLLLEENMVMSGGTGSSTENHCYSISACSVQGNVSGPFKVRPGALE